MIIPIPALWNQRATEVRYDQIDQILHSRTHRLMAGLSIDAAFQSVQGVLVVTVGYGKSLRLSHATDISATIPNSIGKSCRELLQGDVAEIAQLQPLLADLADVQTTVVEKIKCQAGKYVDRVMAIAVVDPGIWTSDFDRRLSYTGFCDANRLAEGSGVTVIDNFPARDLAVGGSGRLLESIPLWMLFADRNPRIAERHRFLYSSARPSALYSLPASDGLDSEVPAIEHWRLADVDQSRSQLQFDQLADVILKKNVRHETGCTAELLIATSQESDPIQAPRLREQLSQRNCEISVVPISELGFNTNSLPAITAAFLGLMHIDQMPANVPWLTGASSQRILGRLTPGRPANWRQLVRAMADVQPAAMKLKDAV